MLKTLTIKGFRCFRELRVDPLTRVNLFVGMNNAGKTSLLEAAELVAIGGIEGLVRSAMRRDEKIQARKDVGEEFKAHVIDPSHLFFGHNIEVGKSFKIEGCADTMQWVKCTVEEASHRETLIQSLLFQSHATSRRERDEYLTISPFGGVLASPLRKPESGPRVNFLAAEAVETSHLGELWDALVLTPGEDDVIQALQIMEPSIDRLAFLSESRGTAAKILIKLTKSEQRLPLGTLGGGVRHLLALALNLFSARGGVLLVDEIDTGLHHSVMVGMWRLVIETAQRLDIQVFATTHSLDCVQALAQIRRRHPQLATEVTVHRVEKDAAKTVVYNTDEILIAEENELEVR